MFDRIKTCYFTKLSWFLPRLSLTRTCPEESEEAFEWRVAFYRQEFPNMVQNNIKRGEVEMKVEEQEDS